jgi:hypothetical protein
MTGRGIRTERCGTAEARKRLQHARQFVEVAEIAAEDQRVDGSLEYANASATLAVLGGIAAADAICCSTLGRRSRADDHRDAERLLGDVELVGNEAARTLRALVALKDDAQYGFYAIGSAQLTGALRKARRLVDLATDTVASGS